MDASTIERAQAQLVPVTNQVAIPPTTGAGSSSVPRLLFGQHPDEDRAVLVVNIGTTIVYYGHREDMTQLTGVPVFPGGAVVVPTTEPLYVLNAPNTAGSGLVAYAAAPRGLQYTTPGTGVASSTVTQGAAGATPWPVDVSDRAARLLGSVVQGTAAAPTAPWSVYNAPAPGSIQVSGTAAAAAALSVALPAVAGKVNYLQGFTLTSGAPAATVVGLLGITGVNGAPLNFQFVESATVGGLLRVEFADPLPATAANLAITVALPAVAGGAVTALVLEGSVQ
jgi:hypothetical protein